MGSPELLASANDPLAGPQRLRTPLGDLEAVLYALDDFVVVFDAAGRIVECNGAAERAWGLDRAQVVGRALSDIVTVVDAGSGPMRTEDLPVVRAFNSGRLERSSMIGLRRYGETRWVRAVAVPLPGRPARVAVVATDITPQVLNQAALSELNEELEQRVTERTAELEAALGELESFSYSASHDLRAPLRTISLLSESMLERERVAVDEPTREMAERIHAAAERMSTLIDVLLRLSAVTRLELVPVPLDLSEMAREEVEHLAHADPERCVEVEIQSDLRARGDERLMGTVLHNLLANAWKFTATTEGARIEVGVTPGRGSRAFFVRDNGAGFDMAEAEHLFQPFHRLHGPEFAGSGIGLATVHRIVTRHGGRIWFEAATGRGATFSFTLPTG
jgi:PAS domain S-box-containing protein